MPADFMTSQRLKIRLFLWSFLLVTIGFLLWQNIVPNGHAVYWFKPGQNSWFINSFEPKDRLKQAQQEITVKGDLVYFNLKTPRAFDRVKLTLEYEPEDELIVEVGLLRNKDLWRYEIKPIYNKFINQFYQSGDWGVMESGNTIFLQRQETYSSIKQFLDSNQATETIAVYNYNLPNKQCQKIDETFLFNKQTNYIIANYQVPKLLADNYYVSQLDFDLKSAERDNQSYKFMIRVPGLKDSQTGEIKIRAIKAEVFGKTWRQFFKL